MSDRIKGILCILSAAFFFALMGVFVRLAGDVPSIQKSFFRNLVAMLFAFSMMLRKRTSFKVKKGARLTLLLRAVFGTIGILCSFYAVDRIPLADSSALGKMSPFFAVLASAFLLKEKLAPVQIAALAGAFGGALCIIKPTFSNLNLTASLVGFAGGIGAGFAYTFVRMLGQRGEKGSYIVFFFSLFSSSPSQLDS